MKTLYLLRHGHAESKLHQPDSGRNLDDEGIEEVQVVANAAMDKRIKPELILSSHANRAVQTAEIAAKTLGVNPSDIIIERGIYYTDTETLVDIIKSQDDALQSIMLTGHNPTVTWFAQQLSGDVINSIPTAGLVAFESDTEHWSLFLNNKHKYLFHIYPGKVSS